MDEGNKPDQIEKLVQQAAEGAQFEFNEGAWSAMEAKLDGKSWRIGAWWKFGLPILLIALLAIFLWQGPVDVLNPKSQINTNLNADASPKEEQKSSSDFTKENRKGKDEASTSVVQDQPDIDEGINARKNAERTPRMVQRKVSVTSRLVTNKLKAQESSSVAYYSNEVPAQNMDIQNGLSGPGKDNAILMTDLPERTSLVRFNGLVYPWVLDSAFTKLGQPDTVFRLFTYGVMVSLDLSSTRLEGFTDPGTMVGLVGEYRINQNWAVQSGIAYATKIYSALGSEYQTPDWAFNAPNDFGEVLAKCLVIDIPINVKRYFTTQKGNQWFLAGGLSSYIMLREDYTYEYSPARPAWPSTWRYENQNQHYFGILNVSGGIVKPLTKKINVQIEPFMKVPMTGIGQGKVKFLSFGTNLTFVLK